MSQFDSHNHIFFPLIQFYKSPCPFSLCQFFPTLLFPPTLKHVLILCRGDHCEVLKAFIFAKKCSHVVFILWPMPGIAYDWNPECLDPLWFWWNHMRSPSSSVWVIKPWTGLEHLAAEWKVSPLPNWAFHTENIAGYRSWNIERTAHVSLPVISK